MCVCVCVCVCVRERERERAFITHPLQSLYDLLHIVQLTGVGLKWKLHRHVLQDKGAHHHHTTESRVLGKDRQSIVIVAHCFGDLCLLSYLTELS